MHTQGFTRTRSAKQVVFHGTLANAQLLWDEDVRSMYLPVAHVCIGQSRSGRSTGGVRSLRACEALGPSAFPFVSRKPSNIFCM